MNQKVLSYLYACQLPNTANTLLTFPNIIPGTPLTVIFPFTGNRLKSVSPGERVLNYIIKKSAASSYTLPTIYQGLLATSWPF